MSENSQQMDTGNIMKELNKRSTFESIVFHLNSTNYEEAKQIISQFPKEWVQRIIYQAGRSYIFNYKLLGDLFSLTGKSEIKFNISNSCKYYHARECAGICLWILQLGT